MSSLKPSAMTMNVRNTRKTRKALTRVVPQEKNVANLNTVCASSAQLGSTPAPQTSGITKQKFAKSLGRWKTAKPALHQPRPPPRFPLRPTSVLNDGTLVRQRSTAQMVTPTQRALVNLTIAFATRIMEY